MTVCGMQNLDTTPESEASAGLFGPAYRALTVGLVAIVTLVAFEVVEVIAADFLRRQ